MKRKQSLIKISLFCLAALVATGCGPGFLLKTPEGFVELEDQEEYAYRATSAQGVVLAVRAQPNRPKGNLGFWTDAIDIKLRNIGYTAVEAKDIKTKSGASGKQLRYTRLIYDSPHVFWMTVFVTPNEVFVVETGGDERNFEKSKAAVTAAIESFQP
jgi:hypothetical protein